MYLSLSTTTFNSSLSYGSRLVKFQLIYSILKDASFHPVLYIGSMELLNTFNLNNDYRFIFTNQIYLHVAT